MPIFLKQKRFYFVTIFLACFLVIGGLMFWGSSQDVQGAECKKAGEWCGSYGDTCCTGSRCVMVTSGSYCVDSAVNPPGKKWSNGAPCSNGGNCSSGNCCSGVCSQDACPSCLSDG
ncbi:MAG: hypothetical protein PHN39_01285, partial [Candidatus Pacebacteria bacterium]|nr:hypothetical protein [Candidatus Paceibacterota bacterium]